jgi:SAM-dependent methyltransferase
MSVTRMARDVKDLAISRATCGGGQNFLGAKWVEHLVDNSPTKIREHVALRLLSLSPHYFYDRDIRNEAERNRRSRQALVDALIAPYLNQSVRVLDYGCGPGYMAYAVAEIADHVYAVDISRGVLACAKVLNGRPNITFRTPTEIGQEAEMVDLAYSFAVVQHLRTELLLDALGVIAGRLRPNGVLLLHFAIPGQGGWRTEAEWARDKSIGGRAKMRYALNCFGRSADEMETIVSGCGFTDVVVRPLADSISVPGDDDILRQHWLTARRL